MENDGNDRAPGATVPGRARVVGDEETLDGPASAAQRLGDQLPSRIANFRVLDQLGRGGMGVVYRAEDQALRREVALKVLPDTGSTDESRRRFLREARSGAAISHPNVAGVYQVGEAFGRIYIAMELVDGEPLRARMKAPMELGAARDIALQIARGLGAAHARGLIHRDLKPENVMITKDGVAKLLDFGLAKEGSDRSMVVFPEPSHSEFTTEERRIMGTPAYMSPEQALGDPLDARSDVFSFGTVFYEMLAGARPFVANSSIAMMAAIARDAPVPLHTKAPNVDADTEAIIMRCLAKAPGDRFANGNEIAEAIAAGQPTPSRTGASWTGSRSGLTPRLRPSWRRPPIVAAGVAALALVVAGGVWLVHRGAGSAGGHVADSSNPQAQRLFDEAIQSFHEDTGHERELLKRAVQLDPTFGGAYVRLLAWSHISRFVTHRDATQQEVDQYRKQALELELALSPRDRQLLECMTIEDPPRVNAALDAYLAKYPDDDMAWVMRFDGSDTVVDRALAARPTLPQIQVWRSRKLEQANKVDEAAKVLDDCLTSSPHAVDCLWARVEMRSRTGACSKVEEDARLLVDLEQDSPSTRPLLASVLAGRGAPPAAVSEALGDPAGVSDFALAQHVPTEVLMPLYTGDLERTIRVAKDMLDRVPAGNPEIDHCRPAVAAVLACDEEGNTASAGQIASDYLARRDAWKAPDHPCEMFMVQAAARAGKLTPQVASDRLTAAYAGYPTGIRASKAWAATYAFAAQTPDEARAALEELHALGAPVPADVLSRGYGEATGEVLFLAGRGEAARPLLERTSKDCRNEFSLTTYWAHAQLGLGELDEAKGDRASACAHYASVIRRWGEAKPRSVTADAARTRAKALGCAG